MKTFTELFCTDAAAELQPAGGLIQCFATDIEAGDANALPKEIMYAPAGISTIYPKHVKTGKPIEVTINVKPEAVEALHASREFWQKLRPGHKQFGDKNHEEKEATFWPGDFRWDARGVMCAIAEWTKLGAACITGKTLRTFSPALATDLDETALTDDGGVLRIKKGKRGSKENPAEIMGSRFCIGTLTNMAAFDRMQALFAESAVALGAVADKPTLAAAAAQTKPTDPPAPKTPAVKQGVHMRKVKLTKDRGADVANTVLTLEDAEALAIVNGGGGIFAEDAAAFESLKSTVDSTKEENEEMRKQLAAHNRAKAVQAVAAAVKRGAVNPKQTVHKIVGDKDTEVLYQDHLVELCCENPDMLLVVEGMSGKANLTTREVKRDKRDTAPVLGAQPISESGIILAEGCSVEEAVRGYAMIQAEARRADAQGEKFERVDALRRSAGRIYDEHLRPHIAKGDCFGIQAEWFEGLMPAEANGQVMAANSLAALAATNIVVQDSLVLLEKLLLPLMNMSFDLSGKGAVYKQVLDTRTRAVPVVNDWDDNNPGYSNSDLVEYAVTVTMDTWKYCQHTVYAGSIAASTRNILQSALGPQVYAVAKALFEVWTGIMTVANYDKTAILARQGYTVAATPDRKTLIGIDNDLDTLLNPEDGRVALMSTSIYNLLREDPYLVSYLYAGPESTARTSGSIGERENIMPHKTQSFNGRADGVKGFAQTASANALVARVPILAETDANVSFPGIRDVITHPKTGLSLLVTKAVAVDGASVLQRTEALFGANKAQANAGLCLL